ncbi:MAG: leucyl/phenylalanyl-tRNA--protein transferase, partial [Sphingomonas sp.]
MTSSPSREAPAVPFEPLDPQIVLGAYAVGVFPMADSRDADEIYWVEPQDRAVLPLDGFHLSQSLRKTIVRERFRVTVDQRFGAMMRLCAESVSNRPDTWINPQIEDVFNRLHALG